MDKARFDEFVALYSELEVAAREVAQEYAEITGKPFDATKASFKDWQYCYRDEPCILFSWYEHGIGEGIAFPTRYIYQIGWQDEVRTEVERKRCEREASRIARHREQEERERRL